jgi:hypothetical protein
MRLSRQRRQVDCYLQQRSRCSWRRYLLDFVTKVFRLQKTPFFPRVVEDAVERRCTLRRPSSGWLLSHVSTHRCRLPELEGSVIFFLARNRLPLYAMVG